ncbi:hypothetical protein JR316_0011608 [Psilocybe cubensis]|uniref:Uncharacterized protein n=2 Tax=Psilocybe cubensis TaxID=181762 RepID=A0ACB8GKL4_PSICU|nr:hypothetical protein JR316_0011608 [Psilocybe cubensis]KAH9476039.1 hypothetical protein JR316_0011608 [Psilocybe cubensis]
MSPSSSFSSTDSAPRSEPTSDEQPDLGAFTTVLREWTHLQPIQRIPVQIHSATSSTTPTYQPEQSIAGSDYRPRNSSSRRSRLSSRGGFSDISSFTRPPSSSVQPEGSTVWNQELIASYLHSTTPSNEILSEADDEEDGGEGETYGEQEYTPSPPNSLASTALTVEIASEIDFPSFDGSHDSRADHLDPTPSPYVLDPGIVRAIAVESDGQRLDSRETAHPEDETEDGEAPSNHGDSSSQTSRDYVRSTFRDMTYPSSASQSHTGSQQTSVQLLSQARAHSTTGASSSDSLALFHATSGSPNAAPSVSLSSVSHPYSSHSNNNTTSNSSTSTSTLISALLNRSRNPLPPRTTSDSSITTSNSASSSNFSLLSYQIPETPPIEEESDSEPRLNEEHSSNSHHNISSDPFSSNQSIPSTSSSVSLKSQRSMHSSEHSNTLSSSTSTQTQVHQRLSVPSSMSHISPATRSDLSLPNPHSPSPAHQRDLPSGLNHSVQPPTNKWGTIPVREFGVVDDLGTPDQPPSETFLFDPSQQRRKEFLPVDDIDDEEDDIDKPLLSVRTPKFSYSQDSPKAPTAQASSHAQVYDRPGPSSIRVQPSAFSDRPHLEPQDEDDDEAEDDYPYRYPYAHTPKSNAQALTPKGILHVDSQAPLRRIVQPETIASQAQIRQYPRQFDLPSSSHSQRSVQKSAQILQHSQTTHEEPVFTHVQPVVASQSHPQPRKQNELKPWSGLTQPIPSSSQYPPLRTDHSSSHRHLAAPAPVMESSSKDEFSSSTQRHRYPHSLLGLHELPSSLGPAETQELSRYPYKSSVISPSSQEIENEHRPLVEMDSTEALHHGPDDDTESEQPLPSLGYLDEALSFIAAERARWNAAREGPGSTSASVALDTDATDSREVGGGDGAAIGSGEEEAGKQVIDNGQDIPKRKRRRKRPPRAHATPLAQTSLPLSSIVKGDGVFEESSGTPLTPVSSPKKKRSKSASTSMSAPGSTAVLDSPSKVKGKGKVVEKEFLVPPSPKKPRPDNKRDNQPVITILRRPPAIDPGASHVQVGTDEDDDAESDGDGGRTPTNGVQRGSEKFESINLVGKKGRRIGRKERQREKAKRDLELKQEEGLVAENISENIRPGIDSDGDDDDDNDDDEGDGADPLDDEDEQTNDSLSQISLLKPPRRNRSRSRRRKSRDTAYIHSLVATGGTGEYKSTPATPKRLHPEGFDAAEEEEASLDVVSVHASQTEDLVSKPSTGQAGEKKKRTRTKRVKTLTHAKSDPSLRLDAKAGGTSAQLEDSGDAGSKKLRKGKGKAHVEEIDILDMDRNQLQRLIFASSGAGSRLLLANQHRTDHSQFQVPPDSKRGRLLSLAAKLGQLFPEQREDLGKVIARIERQGAEAAAKAKRAAMSLDIDPYGYTYNHPAKKSRKGRNPKTGTGGAGNDAFDFNDIDSADPDDQEDQEEEIDPRGRPPRKGDVLIHVFIDHSNILIGLLSHLKRHPLQRKISSSTPRGRPASTVLTKATTITSNSNDKSDPASAFAAVKSTSTRPLPIPTGLETSSASTKRPLPIPVSQAGNHPIPLPSFATISRSLPVGSVINASGKDTGVDDFMPPGNEQNSDGEENTVMDLGAADAVGTDALFVGALKKEKKAPKHMWHAALTLILERGRPITRRVVVTSSPLYQPMESIERLGYELRVFIRVPDFGDGMDRERYREKERSLAGKAGQSTPGVHPGPNSGAKKGRVGHARHISGSTSTESGSGGAGSGHASGGGVHAYTGNANDNISQAKVKYREQGVDELLQLKLHQALADTDNVPEGSTIVLATGDGNMGQFSEDGFLGPVRTALRRGWKVELYAWEDGLSRAWRREFGAGSEWGRRGMFRVIGMEQFASGLVEAAGWS